MSTALAPAPDPAPVEVPRPSPVTLARLALMVMATFYVVSVLRFGWVSDDGFITARSIQNLLEGHGLVANVGYRVQSFTSPLWMLLCLPLQRLTGSPYTALVLAGLLFSAAFVAVVVRGF